MALLLCGAGLANLGGQPTPVHGLVKALPFQQEDDRSGYIAASYGHAGLSNRRGARFAAEHCVPLSGPSARARRRRQLRMHACIHV